MTPSLLQKIEVPFYVEKAFSITWLHLFFEKAAPFYVEKSRAPFWKKDGAM